jgi:hypothetical protein
MIAVVAIVISLIFFVISPNIPAKDYISRPIAIWFSAMENDGDINYLSFETDEVIKMIGSNLDIFEVKVCEPSESDSTSNEIVLNVIVGCYNARGHSNMKELRIRVAGLDGDDLMETYETVSEFKVDQIVRRIRERIFNTYPPRGTIFKLQPKEDEPSEEQGSRWRQVFLDIGSRMGVREGDSFDVIAPDKTGFSRNNIRITIWESSPMRSISLVSWDKKIEEGDGVEWVKVKEE